MTIMTSRRAVLASGVVSALLSLAPRAVAQQRPASARVIVDNDFSGDPDGLFQMAHHLLCRSVKIPLIVGSHLQANSPWDNSPHQATDAANKARELLKVMGKERSVVPGAEFAIPARQSWKPSPATAAIVREAMRDDTKEPLFYAAGAGLTDLALAWLAEPKIGKRLKLVWIGGNEHAALAYPPPGPPQTEFNFTIDPLAAQIIFNESDIEIWQVPRDAYRQMLFTLAELDDLGRSGALGAYLKAQIDQLDALIAKLPIGREFPVSETYVLGDSPLVTLTALQSVFEPDPSSSSYVRKPTPRVDAGGRYQERPDGRAMRVYTRIDSGMTFRDMVSRFRGFGGLGV